jgi:pimeloyl-ACP methyl ester carboxylesterase
MPSASTQPFTSRRLACLGPHGFHRIAYTQWGDPDNAHVVICVHGLTRNSRDFDALAQRLCAHARVLCPDVAGRGASDWLSHPEDYGYPLYLADMAALIARSGAAQVDWVGTSMGGLIGMLMAAQPGNPIRRLVVNDVGPFIPKAALERIATYVGAEVRFDSPQALEAYLRRVHAPFGPLTDAQWAHLAAHGSRTLPGGGLGLAYDPGIANAFRTAITDVDLWPVWRAIAAPVLITRGARSDLLLADTARAMIDAAPQGSRLVEFEGIGHAPTFMAEDQLAAVEAFLLD